MKDYKEMADSVLRRRDEYDRKRKQTGKRIAAALSCLCLAALLGVGVWHSPTARPNRNDVESTKMPMVKAEDQRGTQEDLDAGGPDSGDSSTATTVDAPVSPDHGDDGALTAYDAVWGGSYLDESGHWVVLLTEDTPENREKVLQMNPQLGDDTIFREATYSRAYLTELMEKVSAAMRDGLPDVTSAALREERNRVEIDMTAENPESEAALRDLDTLGGALEFRIAGGAVTEDLPLKK